MRCLLVTAQLPEQARGKLFCDVPRGFCQRLLIQDCRGKDVEPARDSPRICLCAVTEEFVDKPTSCSGGYSLNELSEDNALLILQISEMTSFVETM